MFFLVLAFGHCFPKPKWFVSSEKITNDITWLGQNAVRVVYFLHHPLLCRILTVCPRDWKLYLLDTYREINFLRWYCRNVGVHLDIYELISFNIGMGIVTTELFSVIVVWMTLTFSESTGVVRGPFFSSHFLLLTYSRKVHNQSG